MRTFVIILVIFAMKALGDAFDHPHGKPVNVFGLDDNQEFVTNTTAIDEIFLHEEVKDRKMIIVSIIGALRKGESFFLDYCLRFMYATYKSVNYRDNALDNPDWMGLPDEPLHGFSWKAGPHRHTTGIVFWSDVFLSEKTLSNGGVEKYAIVLIDTQGLFDSRTSPVDSVRIFAFGTLLSSVQIFNLNGVAHESRLEYLDFAADYASITTQVKPFQNLLFLMRDWSHESSYKDSSGGGTEYLDTFLQIKDEQSQELKDVRKHIKESFANVNCYPMPHPGLNITTNSNNDGRLSELDEEFKKQLREVIEWLLSPEYLVNKRMLNVEVTGAELSSYIKSYFETFQSPETPSIQSIFEVTAVRQLGLVVDKVMKYYVLQLASCASYPEFDEVRMQRIQKKAKEITLLAYDAHRKMGSRVHVEKFRQILAEDIDIFFSQWTAAALETRQMLTDMYTENEKKVSRLNQGFNSKVRNLCLNIKLTAQNESFAEEMLKRETETLSQKESINSNTTLKQEEKDAMIKQIQDENEVLVHKAQQMQKQVQAKEENDVMEMVAEITKTASAELANIFMVQKGSYKAAAAIDEAERDMQFNEARKMGERHIQRIKEREREEKARREEDRQRQEQLDFLKAQMTEQAQAQVKTMESEMQQENERRRAADQRSDAELKAWMKEDYDLIRRKYLERKRSSQHIFELFRIISRCCRSEERSETCYFDFKLFLPDV